MMGNADTAGRHPPTDAELEEMLASLYKHVPRTMHLLHDEVEDPYGVSLPKLMALLALFQRCKDEGYGRSWAKHGEAGVFGNITRKTDRLSRLGLVVLGMSIASRRFLDDAKMAVHIALIDALMDIASYAFMWVSYIAKIRRFAFDAWLQNVWCTTTGIPFATVVELLDKDIEEA